MPAVGFWEGIAVLTDGVFPWPKEALKRGFLFLMALGAARAGAVDSWNVEVIRDGYRAGKYACLCVLPSGEPAISYYDYADGDLEYSWRQADEWWTVTVDSAGDVGSYTSMVALPTGQPAISYLDAANYDLKYAWLDHEVWYTEVIDPNAGPGHTSLRLLDSGRPAVAYAGDETVGYAYHDGIQWRPAIVDAVPVGGGQISLALREGKPALTYYDANEKDLKFAELVGADPANPADWDVTAIDSAGDAGRYNSLAVAASGQLVVCYYEAGQADLKYAYRDLGVWIVTTIDAENDVGKHCSLGILPAEPHSELEGMPVVSYFDGTTSDLKFAWFDGLEWQTGNAVDTYGESGFFSSLAFLPSGQPIIAYLCQTETNPINEGALKCAWFQGFGWRSAVVEDMRLEGKYASLKILPAGDPAISFYDWTAGCLKCTRRVGQTWHTTVVDDGDGRGYVGFWSSLAILPNGRPAISYQDQYGWDSLKYAWFDGADWQTSFVDAATQSGESSSLGIWPVTGQPCISYARNGDLCYAWFDGDAWHPGNVVDGNGDVGYYSSLTFLPSGQPIISYRDKTSASLKCAVLDGDDPSDPQHWRTEIVDATDDVGEWTSMKVWRDQPAISYHDVTHRYLKFAWSDGTQWRSATIDAKANTGQYTSLAIIGETPAICFRNNGDLKYAELTGTNPADPAAWTISLIDSGNVGYCSLAVLDGRPAVAYYDDQSADLKFAVGVEGD